MPTYIFKNKKTDEVFELRMRISELDAYKANNADLKQVPTAPNFRLKGTGWYETDFKTGNKKNIAQSDNDNHSTTKVDDKKQSPKEKTASTDSTK
jgi:predicted nucleic acid-binding Zn ribbon protein